MTLERVRSRIEKLEHRYAHTEEPLIIFLNRSDGGDPLVFVVSTLSADENQAIQHEALARWRAARRTPSPDTDPEVLAARLARLEARLAHREPA